MAEPPAEPTGLSALQEEKRRVLIIVAALINDLEDAKKLVTTTLQKCQNLRNEYLDEMFPDDGNRGSPQWDGEEGGESEEKDDDPDDAGDKCNEPEAKRQKIEWFAEKISLA